MFDQIKAKQVKIRRENPNNVTPIHVNDMIVSHDGNEFYLSFAEIEPPALLAEEELEQLEFIEAFTKVKLVISPAFAEAVVRALNENIEKFKFRKGGK